MGIALSPSRRSSFPGFLAHNRSLGLASTLRPVEIADQRPPDHSGHRAVVLDGAGLESGVQIAVEPDNHRRSISHARTGISRYHDARTSSGNAARPASTYRRASAPNGSTPIARIIA